MKKQAHSKHALRLHVRTLRRLDALTISGARRPMPETDWTVCLGRDCKPTTGDSAACYSNVC